VKTIAYLRISTVGQDCDNQRFTILDYAHRCRIDIDEFVSIQASSRKTLRQRGIPELLKRLEPGDVLLVSELSRLGRSVGQIIQMIDDLVTNRIRFVAIKENIELSGKQDIQTKVMVTMFSLFAEIERDLISERTKEGITAARINGKTIGRPKDSLGKSKFDGKENEIRLLLEKAIGITSIAKILGVSRTALRHFIRTRRLV